MCAAKRLLLVALIVSVLLSVGETQHQQPVSDKFLHCLCRVLSECNTSIGCTEASCGPYLITIDFWIDAGKPKLLGDTGHDDAAYTRCVNDMSCAKNTIRQYMKNLSVDCNKDGVVNATDYFMIHYHGPYECPKIGKPVSPKYTQLKACMDQQ